MDCVEQIDENIKSESKCLSYSEYRQEDNTSVTKSLPRNIGTDYSFKHRDIVWINALFFLFIHIACVSGFIMMFMGHFKLKTVVWMYFYGYLNCEGVTIGAHRYYTHRSFKASPFLRAIFVFLHTGAGQNSMFTWVRDHRLHHRYTDTDADPHNSKRGFFFSHIGWLMVKKHPYVIEFGRKINMSDLKADWMVMFQKKYFMPLYIICGIFLPVWVPIQFFGETWWKAIWCCYFIRYTLILNGTWLVNSAAHLYGTRPYDKNLQPVESWFVSMVTLGEGWHNYHHAYPWDYKAAEFTFINASAKIIKFFETIGLAYDLKTVSPETVTKRILRTGDGTHHVLGSEEARSAVTAVGPLHPLNPTYSTTRIPTEMILKTEGLPLFHEKDVFDSDNDKMARNLGSV